MECYRLDSLPRRLEWAEVGSVTLPRLQFSWLEGSRKQEWTVADLGMFAAMLLMRGGVRHLRLREPWPSSYRPAGAGHLGHPAAALFAPIPLGSGSESQSLRSTLNTLAIQPRRKAQKPSFSCRARRGPPAMNRACFSSATVTRLAGGGYVLNGYLAGEVEERQS